MTLLQIILTVVLLYSLVLLSIVLTIHLYKLWRDWRKLSKPQTPTKEDA